MIGGKTGPFIMAYQSRFGGPGVMLSAAENGWALSGVLFGRGVVGGWIYKTQRPSARRIRIAIPQY